MKDLIKRISIGAVATALLVYVSFLYFTGTTIVQTGFAEYNLVYTVVLVFVSLLLLVFFGAFPVYFKLSKPSLFVLGLALIVMGDSVLLNNVQTHVYLSDIVRLLGVVLTLLAWTNVLVTDKVKEEKANSKIEIIEV